MNEKELIANQKSLEYSRDVLKDNFFFMTEHFNKLELLLSEREFNFTLTITSITVAFLSLILPLINDKGVQVSRLTIISLILASLFGFISIAFSNYIDSKLVPKKKEKLLSEYLSFANNANNLYLESLSANLDNSFQLKVNDFYSSINDIEKTKADLIRKHSKYSDLCSLFNWIFIWSFIIGFGGILLAILFNFK
jgi:hypothetical protein